MKAIVLNSGGADSSTCLSYVLTKGYDEVVTVSIDYGQRHVKELRCAEMLAQHYNIRHKVLDLKEIFRECQCPLLHKEMEIEHSSYSEQKSTDGVKTYVPFRNGLFLSAVASYGMSLYPDDEIDIYIANHSDDYASNAYADTSPEFIGYMTKAIEQGTYNKVHIVAPFTDYNKAGIIRLGLELKTPYQLTWSCYEGNDRACGKCATCIDRLNAFKENGSKDPLEYE